MFKLAEFSNRKFIAEINTDDGEVIAEFEMMDLSYNRWNDIGFMVVPEVALKIKDPKNPTKMIEDVKQQQLNDAIAENKRNAMRIVESIEGGSGIDWGGLGAENLETLEQKAMFFMDKLDTPIFLGLLAILRNRAFGARISAKDAQKIFPDVQEASRNGSTAQAHDD